MRWAGLGELQGKGREPISYLSRETTPRLPGDRGLVAGVTPARAHQARVPPPPNVSKHASV